MKAKIQEATELLRSSKHTTVFSGAGVSVESGIPTFRGEAGLWEKYDPSLLQIQYFHQYPERSWKLIKELFYDVIERARPNPAHIAVARMEEMGIVKAVITQNIDNLHQEAGSKIVYEFHGTVKRLVCTKCEKYYDSGTIDLSRLPPTCLYCKQSPVSEQGSLLKPDFVFFGEPIPDEARASSFAEANLADTFLVIGTSGEVMPACHIPVLAKQHGAKIIEINPNPSSFSSAITDIFLQGQAGYVMSEIQKDL